MTSTRGLSSTACALDTSVIRPDTKVGARVAYQRESAATLVRTTGKPWSAAGKKGGSEQNGC